MQELLWLLLPIAAASGWFAAGRSSRRAIKNSRLQTSAPSYIKGLNFLLNEQPDKAIDFFVKMLEVDSETVETHLALGNLFRRRGEVDRAIRIHQNLIARPTLNRDQRAQALLELGQDYMSAGLYDRAENLFQELVELNLYLEQSLSNLKVIYQQEKDWEQCLKVAKRLEQVSGQSQRTERAHYYCELSERAAARGDSAQAASYLKKAQMCDADSVRATLLQGRLEMARSSWKPALRTLKKIKRQDPAYLPEALGLLQRCYSELEQPEEYLNYLERSYASYPSEALAVALANELERTRGRKEAIEFLTRHLSIRPGLEVAEYLLRLNPCDCKPREDDTEQLLQQTVKNLLEQRSAYQCVQCGFGMKTLHWQCPSCKNWGSVKPLSGADEERA